MSKFGFLKLIINPNKDKVKKYLSKFGNIFLDFVLDLDILNVGGALWDLKK